MYVYVFLFFTRSGVCVLLTHKLNRVGHKRAWPRLHPATSCFFGPLTPGRYRVEALEFDLPGIGAQTAYLLKPSGTCSFASCFPKKCVFSGVVVFGSACAAWAWDHKAPKTEASQHILAFRFFGLPPARQSPQAQLRANSA